MVTLKIIQPLEEPIRFYGTKDRHGLFSNFARTPVFIDDTLWPTTEHYFQAQKFLDPRIREMIRQTSTPSEAARQGRRRDLPLRRDWEAVKDDVMRIAIRAKTAQHKGVLDLLMSTGNREIIEHTKNDRYWADGGDGSGFNMLGKLWMERRNEERTQSIVR